MNRALSFIMSRRKYLVASLLITLICYGALEYTSNRYIIAYTREGHYCLPYSMWLIKKGEKPGRGDYVSFVGHGIPHFADGVKWVKVLTGMPADRLETNVVPVTERNNYSEVVEINGMPKQLRAQAQVSLYPSVPGETTLKFRVFEKDSRGQSLPAINSQTIPPGKFFVSTPAQRSFDSRYWGLIDEKAILGKAYPIF